MKYLKILVVAFTVMACYPEGSIKPEEVINFEVFPADNILADGTTKHKIRVQMDKDTDVTLRTLKFECSSGSFVGSSAEKPKELETKAKFLNNEIFAEIEWVSSTVAGTVTITCDPVLVDKQGLYAVEKTLTTLVSEVSSLKLSVNSFSVDNNFDSEVTVVGTLKNSEGKGVSSGVNVIFNDIYVSNQNPVGGRYRSESLESGSSSTVSAIYTPGNVLPGQDLYIIGTVMDGDVPMAGVKPDTIMLQITQSN